MPSDKCITDAVELEEKINQMLVNMKMITKYFNVEDYFDNGMIDFKESSGLLVQLRDAKTTFQSVQFHLS